MKIKIRKQDNKMRLRVKRLNYQDLMLMVIIFCCTIPNGLSFFIGDNAFEKIVSFGCVISIVFVLLLVKLKKISILSYKGTIIIAVFRLSMIFNAIIHKNDIAVINEYIKEFLLIFSCCLACEYYIYKEKMENFFSSICNIYIVYLIINTIFMLIYPDGMIVTRLYTTNKQAFRDVGFHFIGFKNYFGFYFLPLLAVVFFDKYYSGRKHIILQMLIVVDVFLAKSSTSIIAVTIFYIILILGKFISRIKKDNKYNFIRNPIIFVSYIFLFILIVIFNSGFGLRTIVSNLFNKASSFTGRTTIWGLAIAKVLKNPILGYGKSDVIYMNGNYWYAHNGILDLLIQGGIVLIVLYIGVIFICYKPVENLKEQSLYKITIAITAMYCVLMLVESVVNYSILFYSIFCIFIHISVLADNNEKVEIKNRMKSCQDKNF